MGLWKHGAHMADTIIAGSKNSLTVVRMSVTAVKCPRARTEGLNALPATRTPGSLVWQSARHTEVTKWAFVLREETPSRGGSAFYQFVPYKFGPYSFCLYQRSAASFETGT